MPPTVQGPSILSKGVETGPTATHFDLACAQLCPFCQVLITYPWQAELLQGVMIGRYNKGNIRGKLDTKKKKKWSGRKYPPYTKKKKIIIITIMGFLD